MQIPRNQFEIANLELQNNSKTTLQGIGLLGTYRLRHVQYPLKENPWRVVQEIANLEQQYKTLQGIGLSGSYWYKDVHYPFKENPWRVVQEIANLEQQNSKLFLVPKNPSRNPARVLKLTGLFG